MNSRIIPFETTRFDPRTYTIESCQAILEFAPEGCARLFLLARGAEIIRQRHQNMADRKRPVAVQARIDKQTANITSLLAAGKSQKQISAETGISEATISRRLKAMAAGAGK